jgi:uncharacterized protein YndB with AHSA1/START domain
MTSPLRISFDVACGADQAFELWTSRIGTWWPRDHTVSGEKATVILEAGVGGRILERTADGVEHEWGKVKRWEPPTRLGYTWYLGRSPDEATEVTVSFIQMSDSTLVEIEHRGWERLGAEAEHWRDRNRTGWETLLPHFAAAAKHGDGGW